MIGAKTEQEKQEKQKKIQTLCSEAVSRVLSVFKKVCGVDYPTTGAIAQKVAQAVEVHGEQELTKVIEAKGAAFRHPLALLKPEMVESIGAELNRERPTEQPTESQEVRVVKEKQIYGIPVSVIEKNARPGESFEDAALRLYEAKRAA